MPRKKKVKPTLDLSLNGKCVIVVETASGPLEITIDDVDVVTRVLRTILDHAGDFPVSAYDDEERKLLDTLLQRKITYETSE